MAPKVDFKLMRAGIRSAKDFVELEKSVTFPVTKLATPKAVLLNNLSRNPNFTYENYFKRLCSEVVTPEEAPMKPTPASDVSALIGNPVELEPTSYINKPCWIGDGDGSKDVIKKWHDGNPRIDFCKQWFKVTS